MEAVEVVKRMDADTLFLAEMTEIDAANNEHALQAQEKLSELGYHGTTTDYTDEPGVRNAHTMGFYTRLGHGEVVRHRLGERFALGVQLDELAVMGGHFRDDSESGRQLAARDAVELSRQTGEMILKFDANAMYYGDRRAAVARVGGHIGRILGMCVGDFYNFQNKAQRAVGKALRIAEMGDGGTMSIFEDGGFHDADPRHQPTVHQHGLSFAIDHIVGTSGVEFSGFKRHEPSRKHGRRLSDHDGLTAIIHL